MKRIWKGGSWVLLLLSATLLGTGCFLPFGWGEAERDTEESTGTITVHLGGIGASTLVPDFGAIVDSYRVTASRSGYDDVVVSDLASASSISLPGLALGTWTVTVEAIDADNGDAVVGISAPESVAVDSAAPTSVTITVGPTTAGNGDLNLTVTWPSSESLTVGAFTLTPDGGSDVSGSLTQSGVTDGVNLSTSGATLSAGSYTLLLQLQRSGADVATVIEAVRIYDNVTTTATIELAAGEIGDTPLAPTGFSVTEESGAVVLNWTDASNTELSYVVERSEDGGSSYVELDGSLAAGTTTYTDTTRVVGTTYTYRVSAVNDFGSSPSSMSLTVVGNEELSIDVTVDEPADESVEISGLDTPVSLGAQRAATASSGYTGGYTWYLNGDTAYPDMSGFSVTTTTTTDDTFTIDTSKLDVGTHTVTVVVENSGGQMYSTKTTLDVEN